MTPATSTDSSLPPDGIGRESNGAAAIQPHGTLTLRTTQLGEMAVVEIANSGPGIPDEILSRIFEPFFTTKPVGKGLGLGLDSVNRIVAKHNGTVGVESRPGATCFQVRLPLERVRAY
jgi:signal transduction histidine kinase